MADKLQPIEDIIKKHCIEHYVHRYAHDPDYIMTSERIKQAALEIANYVLSIDFEIDKEEDIDTIKDDVMLDDEQENFRPQADEDTQPCNDSR